MMYLGDFPVGATVYIPFDTYDGSGASVTMTGFDVTDVEIYKNGNMTQRASDAGYALIDTDGIDIDSTTGFHGFSVDTADNTTADFFTSGADYWVRVNGLTVDSQTLGFTVIFSIDNRMHAGELVKTTIATLASQTSFTLTAGSADDNAYNNCICVVSDIASAVQKAIGVISDYTGSTKTVTLLADPGIFTMAAGDNITIIATQAGLMATPTEIRQEMDSNSTQLAAIVEDTGTTIPATLSTIAGYIDAEVAAILEDTGTTIPALIGTPSVDLATDIAALPSAADIVTAIDAGEPTVTATISSAAITDISDAVVASVGSGIVNALIPLLPDE